MGDNGRPAKRIPQLRRQNVRRSSVTGYRLEEQWHVPEQPEELSVPRAGRFHCSAAGDQQRRNAKPGRIANEVCIDSAWLTEHLHQWEARDQGGGTAYDLRKIASKQQ